MQGIRSAQGQLRQWKEKLDQMGGMSSDAEIPDFKPNTQKTIRIMPPIPVVRIISGK